MKVNHDISQTDKFLRFSIVYFESMFYHASTAYVSVVYCVSLCTDRVHMSLV